MMDLLGTTVADSPNGELKIIADKMFNKALITQQERSCGSSLGSSCAG